MHLDRRTLGRVKLEWTKKTRKTIVDKYKVKANVTVRYKPSWEGTSGLVNDVTQVKWIVLHGSSSGALEGGQMMIIYCRLVRLR